MNRKIFSGIFVILALGILVYDICAGEPIDSWIYVCVGLLVAANLLTIFGKPKK